MRRLDRAARALASAALAAGAGIAVADTPPGRIEVNGSPLAAAAAVQTLREGRLFVSLSGVAGALGDTVRVDPASGQVSCRLAHTGETRTFSRVSGEIRRDGSLLAVLPGAAAVAIAVRPEDQQVPLELVSLLLDASVQVDPGGASVSVRRDRDAAPSLVVRETIPADWTRADWNGSLTSGPTSNGHTLALGAEGRVFDSLARGRLQLSGGTGRGSANLTAITAALTRPSRQEWILGDATFASGWRYLAAPGRGLSLLQPMAGSSFTTFAGGARSGAVVAEGGFVRPEYGTATAGATWSTTGLERDRDGYGGGFGATVYSGDGRDGLIVAHRSSWRSRRHLALVDAAVGSFSGDGLEGRTDYAVDASDALQLGRHALSFRAEHVGEDFQVPVLDADVAGRELLSASWAASLVPGLNAAAGVARGRVSGSGVPAATTATWSAAWSVPRGAVPEVAVLDTLTWGGGAADSNLLQINASWALEGWRPFVSLQRFALETASESATVGTSTDLGRGGFGRAAVRAGDGNLQEISLDWTAVPLLGGRLGLALGGGILRGAENSDGSVDTRPLARLWLQGQLPHGHVAQLSAFHDGSATTVVATVGGTLFDRPRIYPAAGAQAAAGRGFPGRVLGRLFEDRDLDGGFDPGIDAGIGAVRVWLDGSLVAVTDSAGAFRFDEVLPGEHRVAVDFASVRADLTAVHPIDRVVSVRPRVDVTLDFPLARTGGAVGLVWVDDDQDGVYDPGETPVPDVTVLCSCGRDTLTNLDGSFILGDLLPGRITVSVDLRSLPPGLAPALTRIDVDVEAGRQRLGIAFPLVVVERNVEEDVDP